jgi:hypothetical protein
MIRYLAAMAVGVFAFLNAPMSSAHHGWSGYDSATVFNLTGPIARVSYVNPHVEIDVDADGKTWTAILAPLFRMQARGLPEYSLKVGDRVTLVGYPHRDKKNELRAERIVVAGKTVELR